MNQEVNLMNSDSNNKKINLDILIQKHSINSFK